MGLMCPLDPSCSGDGFLNYRWYLVHMYVSGSSVPGKEFSRCFINMKQMEDSCHQSD